MERKIYIWQKDDWLNFEWDHEFLLPHLAEVRYLQGKMIGRMEALGFVMRSEASLNNLMLEVLKSSEIEGELLNPDQVRSSIARRLGMDVSGLVPSSKNVDGVVEMMLDATQNFTDLLDEERLFRWHSALFQAEKKGMHEILVGAWRDDLHGPMQVVSGALGKERVHYEAPAAKDLPHEMKTFFEWFNNEDSLDPVLKAGLAHFWFVTLHPFEDGNGRIARALADLLLARADRIPQRFYSMSAQIRLERNAYYRTLEKSQQGTSDITKWLEWFLECLKNALHASSETLNLVLQKHYFWNSHAKQILNDRQVLLINRLLEGFTGKLTSSKWAKIAKCSQDTALRDIRDLMDKQILQKEAGGGRSTNYELIRINEF